MKLKLPTKLKFLKRTSKKSFAATDWGEILHVSFNTILPFALVALINNDLTLVAVMLVFLSKWRVFAMRFNHLPANIRANMTDLIFKLAMFSFLVRVEELSQQLVLAIIYVVWLLLIKPQSSRLWVIVQSMTAQLVGITALMWGSDVLAEVVILIGIWIVIYSTTFHYISDFDEPMSKALAKIWALLGVELAWIFLHWNLVYFAFIPQYALIQLALSYVVGDLYTSQIEGRAQASKYSTYVVAMIAITLVMIISGDWTGSL